MALEPRLLLDGLVFPEGPRWRDGRLWFSDMHDQEVSTVDLEGNRETVVRVPTQPSGLGWLPDGTLLVVSMTDKKLMKLVDGRLELHADLSHIAGFHCNDMVVDAQGRAYVGNFGFNLYGGEAPCAAKLAMVTPDGEARVVAEDLMFPNGTVITPDGKTLIIGETFAGRLTAFDIDDDGSLSSRRTWANVRQPPDGICLDTEGCIWLAVPLTPGAFLRVAEGGEIVERIDLSDHGAFACMLGGPEGRTLFLLEARESVPTQMSRGNGRIRVVEVSASHTGLP